MFRPFLLSALLFAAPQVSAMDMSLGVNVGGLIDLPDKVSKDHTKFGFGPSFGLSYSVRVASVARLKASLQTALQTGNDRVSWEYQVDGETVRVFDDDHFSMLVGVGLLAGVDVMVPGDLPITPYLGGQVGGVWVGTYHSFGGATQPLLDPTQNDLEDSGNVDPYTEQLALMTELHLGVEKRFGETISLSFETGYSMAFLPTKALKKTDESLNAQREAFGWNAIRLGLGLSFHL
jgi:hypothetical protein